MGRIMLDESLEKERLELHARGLTDAEMAEALGLTGWAVSWWRRSRKLKANVKRKQQPTGEVDPVVVSSGDRRSARDVIEYSRKIRFIHNAYRNWLKERGNETPVRELQA